MYIFTKTILKPLLFVLYKPKVIGRSNFMADGAAILISNHVSMIDPLVLACFLPRQIFFMSKKELFKGRVLKWFLLRVGAFPVNRGNADISAIKHSLKLLKQGKILGVFPEGTRIKSGAIGSFNAGAAALALKANVPIIPVGISNKYHIFQRIVVHIGHPIFIDTTAISKSNNADQIKELTLELENMISRLIKRED